MEQAQQLLSLASRAENKLPLVPIEYTIIQKQVLYQRMKNVINTQKCKIMFLEQEVMDLEGELKAQRHRSLGFEQDLEHIIEQIIDNGTL